MFRHPGEKRKHWDRNGPVLIAAGQQPIEPLGITGSGSGGGGGRGDGSGAVGAALDSGSGGGGRADSCDTTPGKRIKVDLTGVRNVVLPDSHAVLPNYVEKLVALGVIRPLTPEQSREIEQIHRDELHTSAWLFACLYFVKSDGQQLNFADQEQLAAFLESLTGDLESEIDSSPQDQRNPDRISRLRSELPAQLATLQRNAERLGVLLDEIIIPCLASTPTERDSLNRRIVDLGDSLCDRGSSDYFILLLLHKLRRAGFDIERTMSNHELGFLQGLYEIETCYPSGLHYRCDVTPRTSLLNLMMRMFLPGGAIVRREVQEMMEETYLPTARLFSYAINEASGEIDIYSHAPVDLTPTQEDIRRVANFYEVDFEWDTVTARARTIDAINRKYQRGLERSIMGESTEQSLLRDIMTERNTRPGMTLEVRLPNHSLHAPLWQRGTWLTQVTLPSDGPRMRNVHGHVGPGGGAAADSEVYHNVDGSYRYKMGVPSEDPLMAAFSRGMGHKRLARAAFEQVGSSLGLPSDLQNLVTDILNNRRKITKFTAENYLLLETLCATSDATTDSNYFAKQKIWSFFEMSVGASVRREADFLRVKSSLPDELANVMEGILNGNIPLSYFSDDHYATLQGLYNEDPARYWRLFRFFEIRLGRSESCWAPPHLAGRPFPEKVAPELGASAAEAGPADDAWIDVSTPNRTNYYV